RRGLARDLRGTATDGVMNHQPGKIRSGPQLRVAHDVEVRKARKPKRVADPAPTGTLDVDEHFGPTGNPDPRVQRQERRRRVFGRRPETMFTRVQSAELAMRLEDDVDLS